MNIYLNMPKNSRKQKVSPHIILSFFFQLTYVTSANTKLAIVYFDTKPSRAEHTTDRDAAFNLADVCTTTIFKKDSY